MAKRRQFTWRSVLLSFIACYSVWLLVMKLKFPDLFLVHSTSDKPTKLGKLSADSTGAQRARQILTSKFDMILSRNTSDVHHLVKPNVQVRTPTVTPSHTTTPYHKIKTGRETDFWEFGLDQDTYHDERFHSGIREVVEREGRFPWELVDENAVMSNSFGLNITEYIEKYCVIGSPVHHNTGYTSPCWTERTTLGVNTTRLACLPTVYLAGFTRCGSTSLYGYLIKHQHVAKPLSKKPAFWTKQGKKDFRQYVSLFSTAARKIGKTKYKNKNGTWYHPIITVDAEPSTVWKTSCCGEYKHPLRILALNPQTKIVIMVRDPVERAVSHFLLFSKLDMKNYYELCVKKVRQLTDCISDYGAEVCANTQDFSKFNLIMEGVMGLRVGMYFVHIRKWLILYPRDRIFILKSENFFAEPAKHVNEVLKFIGLETMSQKYLDTIFTLGKKRRPALSPSDKLYLHKAMQVLKEFYTPFNEKLAELLHDNSYLSWNK